MLKNSLGIFTSRSLLLSIVFLISACSGLGSSDSSRSSAGPDREYIGWHCQGAIESSDQWYCSEQLLRGGELVSPVQVEAETVEPNFLEINSPEIDSSEINSSEINSSEIIVPSQPKPSRIPVPQKLNWLKRALKISHLLK